MAITNQEHTSALVLVANRDCCGDSSFFNKEPKPNFILLIDMTAFTDA
jgi:hypothetical protein